MKILRSAAVLLLTAALLLTPGMAAGETPEPSMEHFQPVGSRTSFVDVPAEAWYAEDVGLACALGLMEGKGQGRFDPMGGLTRAEAVTLAVRIRSTYLGLPFTGGGDPWYAGALAQAEALFQTGPWNPSVLEPKLEGEPAAFTEAGNMTAEANRLEMACIFARCLDPEEYPRINRIGEIPGTRPGMEMYNEICFLYQAGVLTGDGEGVFHPDKPITRAEAAALAVRVALPERRKAFQLPWTEPEWKAVSTLDGSLRFHIPEDWRAERREYGRLFCVQRNVSLTVDEYEKVPELPVNSLEEFARWFQLAGLGNEWNVVITSELARERFKGVEAWHYQYEQTPGGMWSAYHVYCVESAEAYYAVQLGGNAAASGADCDQAVNVLFSMDLAP